MTVNSEFRNQNPRINDEFRMTNDEKRFALEAT
jgi:hypothetical protein